MARCSGVNFGVSGPFDEELRPQLHIQSHPHEHISLRELYHVAGLGVDAMGVLIPPHYALHLHLIAPYHLGEVFQVGGGDHFYLAYGLTW